MTLTKYDIRKIAEEVVKILQDEKNKEDTILSTEEAAQFLKCAKQTIYNNIKLIPHQKNGKKLLFSKKSLQRIVESGGIANLSV